MNIETTPTFFEWLHVMAFTDPAMFLVVILGGVVGVTWWLADTLMQCN